ncbi:MAG: tyrosine-type recombinase/integrase [Eubacteriales bacterium]|nr:tyrosine-type recombinase/integrase [Eubacteriales bacterium]
MLHHCVLLHVFNRTFKRLENKNIHIDRVTPHALRDTFATRAIENGMNPQTLKKILGHSSLAMTMDLYAHVLPNTMQEEMEKIAKAF